MEHIYDLVQRAEPHVAYFRVILDGWDRTHDRCLPPGGNGMTVDLREQLDRVGLAWLSPEAGLDSKILNHEAHESHDPAEFGLRALESAARDWIHFVRATVGIGMLAWKCVGPSFDDSEFNPEGAS